MKIFDKIESLLDQDSLFTEEAMDEVISYCEKEYPHDDWKKIRKINFEKDKTRIEHWLKSVLKNEPISKDVNGLWFGIYNPVYEYAGDKETSCDFYICGNPDFDKNEIGWACSPKYFPVKRYSNSKILDSIYKKAYSGKNGLGNLAEYPLCLAYTAFIIKELIRYIPKSHFLKFQDEIGILVGFDSGDFLYIGSISKENGLKREKI